MALAYAVIPYIAVRAIEGITTAAWRSEVLKALTTRSAGHPSTTPVSNGMLPKNSDPIEPALKGIGMGQCPGCRKLRGTNVARCVYCGSTEPTNPG